MRDELLLTCTDQGQHPSAQIARIMWTGSETGDGVSIWTAGEGVVIDAIAENTRQTKAGVSRVTSRQAVDIVTRADGGQTFHLPSCPRCRAARRLRDDTLGRLRNWPLGAFDVSTPLPRA